jgi:CBS-domain-containing membrane protein
MFLIGMFLRGAARMSYEQVLLRSALAGETVRRFMHPDPVAAPPEISVRQFVEDYIYRYHFKVFPVVEGESRNLIGCVSTADLKEVPREEWDRRHVSEVTKPCSTANTIGPDADALQAFSKIQENGSGALFVTERNHLLATVSPRDVLRFMAAKMELEGRRGLLPAPRV